MMQPLIDSPKPPQWAVAVAWLAAKLQTAVKVTGLFFGSLNVVLMVVILLQIGMRHLFTGGHQVILGELQWHLYATAMMFGLAYSQVINAHVRVDILSRKWSARRRAVMEILGNVLLIMPFVIVVFLQGLDYVSDSWRVSEHSDSPVGLPWRWLIKSVIPMSFALWFMALFARLLCDIVFLFAPTALSAEMLTNYTIHEAAMHAENHAESSNADAHNGAKAKG